MALVGKESVSGFRRQRPQVNQENPPSIYIIGNDGITLCRDAPATASDGEIAVASQEIAPAPFSGKRLLALWNAVPGIKKAGRSAAAMS